MQHDQLVNDVERIIKKQKVTHRLLSEQIDYVTAALKDCQQSGDLNQLKEQLQQGKPLSKMIGAHKDCYAYISKMGKNMDKLYQKNLQYGQENEEIDCGVVIDLIKTHLLREGQFEAYDELVHETGTQKSGLQAHFQELFEIVKELRQKNLSSAIQWAIRNNEQKLLFELYRQQFIQLVRTEGKESAIAYARENQKFQKFATTHLYEISQLITSLIFISDLKASKYEYLYREDNWNDLLNEFIGTSLKSQNLLQQSELQTIFQAGTLAMPKFIKYNAITRRRSSEVQGFDIPIDIEIGREYKFHSSFVCPVTRDVCLPDNPPMLLKCGHVVSRQSVQKMTQNRSKFKCPTCPIESRITELKQIQFL